MFMLLEINVVNNAIKGIKFNIVNHQSKKCVRNANGCSQVNQCRENASHL